MSDTDSSDDESTCDSKPTKYSKHSKYNKHNKRSDFYTICAAIIGAVEWKVSILLFFIGVIVLSDIYQEGILTRINGATRDGEVTARGTMLQIATIVVFYNVFNVLVRNNFI
jgi:hypothetical protein